MASAIHYLDKALKLQWKRYCRELNHCQAKFSEAAVHDSRVATRRLLSLVELLRPFLAAGRVRKMRRALKHHLDAFNHLRDAQVQLRLVARWRKQVPGADAFYSHLLLLEKRLVKETFRELRHIRTRRMARWIAASRRDLREHHSDLRAERANKRLLAGLRDAFSRVLQARRSIVRRDPASIHRTRVAFKKFRYMAEAIRVMLPSMSRRRLDAFRRYQAMMGDVQDARLLLAALDGFVRDERLDPKEFRALRSRIARQMSLKVTAYLKSADSLERFSPSNSLS